jgi:large subunit ribosomal protein L6
MSRIGKLFIDLPENVNVDVSGTLVKVSGPKGSLEQEIAKSLTVKVEDKALKVVNDSGDRDSKAMHGLYRTLIYNMVKGVSEGWVKELEIKGTGYRAAMQGSTLQMSLGYSHPVLVEPLEGVELTVAGNKITVSGIDKQVVGQMAAIIRQKRKPDAYKGKGVRYVGEEVKLKAGKAKKGK